MGIHLVHLSEFTGPQVKSWLRENGFITHSKGKEIIDYRTFKESHGVDGRILRKFLDNGSEADVSTDIRKKIAHLLGLGR